MTVEEFLREHGPASQPISTAVDRWVREREVADFLDTLVVPGVTVADVLIDERLIHQIPPEVREALIGLHVSESATRMEIAEKILTEVHDGPKHIGGLMSHIQGRIAEMRFAHELGPLAELAPNVNQRGWDLVWHQQPGHDEYIQVKAYQDAHAAVSKLKDLQHDLASGQIAGLHGQAVSQLTFAVNSDIYEEVKRQAATLDIPNIEIRDIHETHEQLRHPAQLAVDHVFPPASSLL